VLALLVWLLTAAPVAAEGVSTSEFEFVHPWRFRPERGTDALAAGWHQPGFDDRAWAVVDFFRPWAEHGATDRDQAAWYRGVARPRPGWRTGVLVLKLHTAVGLDVYVNGTRLPVTVVDDLLERDRFAVARIGDAFRPGEDNLVAMRLHAPSDPRGPSGTVRLAERPATVLSPRELVRYTEREHPGWLLPTWAEDRPTAWTLAGVPGDQAKALLGRDGAISPRNPGLTIVPWLYQHDTGQLFAPDSAGDFASYLHDGHLPLVHQRWTAGSARMEALFFVGREEPALTPTDPPTGRHGLAHYRLAVRNPGDRPLDATLYLAVRPYDVRGGAVPIRTIDYRSEWRSVVVNGEIALRADRSADGFGAAALATADLSAWALRGQLPSEQRVDDRDGYGMGALAYRLSVPPGGSEIVTLTLPVEPLPVGAAAAEALGGVSFEDSFAATVDRWREDLHQVRLGLPDRSYVDAFYASLAYLLLAQVGDRFHPGPLEHNAFWTRDAAYISLALSRAGQVERVRPMVRELARRQLPSGEFPAVIERDGTPRNVVEWDAQGQGIFALVQHYRFTGDRAYLRSVYGGIVRAAEFIGQLSARNDDRPAPLRGLLPPGLSAEDIGSADWHHYWDNFWALAGYDEARAAALVVGDDAAAERFAARRARLARDLLTSIQHVRLTEHQPQIPNGPEDHGGSSDARGTSAALWPIEVLPDERELLRESYAFYFRRYVAPNGGAFKHNLDLLWPYAGLGLAHGYLRLGMADDARRMLRWNLDHQTFPGTYAWAEGVTAAGGFGIGDMPHAWAAAETVSLVRELLVMEEGTTLVLGAGVPLEWLTGGRRIAVDFAPTHFGSAGYELVGDLSPGPRGVDGSVRLRRLGGAAPPGGYRLQLPVEQPPTVVSIDGRARPSKDLNLPSDFGEVVVTFTSR
jgi:hypothetical protein